MGFCWHIPNALSMFWNDVTSDRGLKGLTIGQVNLAARDSNSSSVQTWRGNHLPSLVTPLLRVWLFPSVPKGINRKPLPILLCLLFRLAVNMFKSYFRLSVSVELELKVSINEAYMPCWHETTALILKGIKHSLFWNHLKCLWPGNTDLYCFKFHVPTWKQFHEIS